MSHFMEFVSCISMANENEGKNEDIEHGLCKVQIEEGVVLETLDEDKLSRLMIEGLLLSEGTEIFSKSSFGINDVRVFTGENIDEESKKYVWYELLRLLTGHKVYVPSLNNKITFSKWTCRMRGSEVWKVVMELESSSIIRKIAEFALYPVTNGEADLFEMADKLYQDVCCINDSYRDMKESYSYNKSQLKELAQERELLDKLLEERDKETRSIVVTLLNEKKKKIRELHDVLRRNNIKMSGDDIPDSELINMEVTKPVSQLNSPGKRLRRRRMVEPQNLNEKLQNVNRRKVGGKAANESIIKEEDDDFDDFQFFGISKRSHNTINDNTSENGDDSISFGNDTRSIGSLSDNNNDVSQKRLASLEENDTQLQAGEIIQDHDEASESESETDTSAKKLKRANYDVKHGDTHIESSLETESETDIETDSS